jgi:hypothetical protein
MPGWPLMLYNRYPSDLFMYLLWLRATIAFTFTVLVLDGMAWQQARAAAAAASAVQVPSGVDIPHVSGSTTAGSRSPSIHFSGVPPASKVHVTMEAPPESKQAYPSYEELLKEQEEMKQPQPQRQTSSVKIEEIPTPAPSPSAQRQEQMPIPTPS